MGKQTNKTLINLFFVNHVYVMAKIACLFNIFAYKLVYILRSVLSHSQWKELISHAQLPV